MDGSIRMRVGLSGGENSHGDSVSLALCLPLSLLSVYCEVNSSAWPQVPMASMACPSARPSEHGLNSETKSQDKSFLSSDVGYCDRNTPFG